MAVPRTFYSLFSILGGLENGDAQYIGTTFVNELYCVFFKVTCLPLRVEEKHTAAVVVAARWNMSLIKSLWSDLCVPSSESKSIPFKDTAASTSSLESLTQNQSKLVTWRVHRSTRRRIGRW